MYNMAVHALLECVGCINLVIETCVINSEIKILNNPK